jgi:hypothetical protein
MMQVAGGFLCRAVGTTLKNVLTPASGEKKAAARLKRDLIRAWRGTLDIILAGKDIFLRCTRRWVTGVIRKREYGP